MEHPRAAWNTAERPEGGHGAVRPWLRTNSKENPKDGQIVSIEFYENERLWKVLLEEISAVARSSGQTIELHFSHRLSKNI